LGATGLAATECAAGAVNIDVTSLGLTTGANAGVPFGGTTVVNNFLGLTGRQFGRQFGNLLGQRGRQLALLSS